MPSAPLNREQIIRAAVELLDADGFEKLSMRRLGAKLGSGATSVYWHVGSKDELFSLAAEEVFQELPLPDPAEAGWRSAAQTMAYDLRALLLRHMWLAPVFGAFPVYGSKVTRWVDHIVAVFEAAGYSGSDLDGASDTLFGYVLGATHAEVASRMQVIRTGVTLQEYAETENAQAKAAAADFPRLRARLEAQAGLDLETASEKSFEFGLRTILDGLEARLRDRAGADSGS